MTMFYVHKNKTYLDFIFHKHISIHQLRCVLATSTQTQLNALSEVILNINHGHIKIPLAVKNGLAENEDVISGIIDHTSSLDKRLDIVRKHMKIVVDLVLSCGRYVRSALKRTEKKKT